MTDPALKRGLAVERDEGQALVTTNETARQLGYAAFPLVFLAIAAFIGWRMGKKRNPQRFVGWPVGVAAILLAVGMLGMYLQKKPDAAPPSSETSR